MSEAVSALNLAELKQDAETLLDFDQAYAELIRQVQPYGNPYGKIEGIHKQLHLTDERDAAVRRFRDATSPQAILSLISALEAAKQRGDYFVDTLARHHAELCRQLGLDPDEAGDEEVFAALEAARQEAAGMRAALSDIYLSVNSARLSLLAADKASRPQKILFYELAKTQIVLGCDEISAALVPAASPAPDRLGGE